MLLVTLCPYVYIIRSQRVMTSVKCVGSESVTELLDILMGLCYNARQDDNKNEDYWSG